MLARRGVTVHEINRGGDVTYHGPGQLVGYPIFDLRTLRTPSGGRMGPVDFVRGMEEALIRLCGGFGVRAGRICGLTGVWCEVQRTGIGVRDARPEKSLACRRRRPERKIAAIGIHVARGITSHGFAFNVTTDLSDFELIVPCGIADHAVTSLEKEVEKPGGAAQPGSHRPPGGAQLRPGLRRAGAGGRESGGVARPGRRLQPRRNFRREDTPLQFRRRSSACAAAPSAPIRA